MYFYFKKSGPSQCYSYYFINAINMMVSKIAVTHPSTSNARETSNHV